MSWAQERQRQKENAFQAEDNKKNGPGEEARDVFIDQQIVAFRTFWLWVGTAGSALDAREKNLDSVL